MGLCRRPVAVLQRVRLYARPQPGRAPLRFLKNYDQVPLADAYGYNGVVASNQITRAGCWAHLRRRLIEAEETAREIAREAVDALEDTQL